MIIKHDILYRNSMFNIKEKENHLSINNTRMNIIEM